MKTTTDHEWDSKNLLLYLDWYQFKIFKEIHHYCNYLINKKLKKST